MTLVFLLRYMGVILWPLFSYTASSTKAARISAVVILCTPPAALGFSPAAPAVLLLHTPTVQVSVFFAY